MLFFSHLSTAELNSEHAFLAISLSPDDAASIAFLRSVFMRVVRDLFFAVRVADWRTRLRADFELAIDELVFYIEIVEVVLPFCEQT